MWILKSLMNPTSLVIIWSIIKSVYNIGLRLGSRNSFRNSFVMMFTLDPPSNRTSATIFLPTWTWITSMWGLITTKVIIGLGLRVVTILLPRENLVVTYCLKSKVILKSWPKVRIILLSNNCYLISSKIKEFFIGLVFLIKLVMPVFLVGPTEPITLIDHV